MDAFVLVFLLAATSFSIYLQDGCSVALMHCKQHFAAQIRFGLMANGKIYKIHFFSFLLSSFWLEIGIHRKLINALTGFWNQANEFVEWNKKRQKFELSLVLKSKLCCQHLATPIDVSIPFFAHVE